MKGRLQLEANAIIMAWRYKELLIQPLNPNSKKDTDAQKTYPPTANLEFSNKPNTEVLKEKKLATSEKPSGTENKQILLNSFVKIDAESCLKQGQNYYKSAEYNKAIEEISKALVKIRNAEIYTLRGLAYYKTNQHEKAIDDFTNAIGLAPSHALAYFNRGVIFYEKSQFDKALKDFQKVCDLGDNDSCKKVKHIKSILERD